MVIQAKSLEELQKGITETKKQGFIFLYRGMKDGVFYAVFKQRG